MKSFAVFAVAAGLLNFACSAGDPSQGAQADEGESVASTSEAVCTNYAGTGAVLASLAVAAATEMHRWNAPLDFDWNTTCRNVNAILSLQKPAANGMVTFPGGEVLNSYTLTGVIQDHFTRQQQCNAYQGAYTTNGCWVEAHDLWFWKKAPGTCATDNYFWANLAGTSNTLNNPERLAYQLYFAGYPDNPYLNFRNNGSNVVVDPTVGLTEANTATQGSCIAACAQYSTTSLTGSCCSCNGVTKNYSRSAFSMDMYLCI
jgi:hypothetical protein